MFTWKLARKTLEIIVGNNAWLQVPEVRRALLSNPRLGTDQVALVGGSSSCPKCSMYRWALSNGLPSAST